MKKTDPNQVSFPKRMRGYQVRRVDAYISSLCADFAQAEEDYQSRIVALEKEIARLREDIEGYRAVESENQAMRSEIEQLRISRLRLLHRAKEALRKQRERSARPSLTPQQRQARVQAFFRNSAELVRLVGHTGQKVSRIARALPMPKQPMTPIKPVPTTAKQAKKLAKKLSKQEKQRNYAEKKIKKAQKIEAKQRQKLQQLK